LRSWYVTLGDSFLHSTVIPPPHVRDTEGRARLVECVRKAISDDGAHARSALVLLWANQHLDALWRLESHLGTLAVEASTSAEGEPAGTPPTLHLRAARERASGRCSGTGRRAPRRRPRRSRRRNRPAPSSARPRRRRARPG